MTLTCYKYIYMHRLSSHHQKRSQQAYKKGKAQIIKVGNVILDLMTLTRYKHNICIDYHHIIKRDHNRHTKREKPK